MKIRKTIGFLTLALASIALAQDPAPESLVEPTKTEKGWNGTAGASAVINSGNSVNQTVSGNLLVGKKWDQNKVEFSGNGAYGRAEDETGDASTNTKNWRTQLRYDRFLNEPMSIFGYGFYGQDEPAGFENRYGGGSGFAHQLIKTDNDMFKYEAGYDYTREDRVAPAIDDDIHSGRLFLQYDRKISDWANFTQSFENLFNLQDSEDYRLNSLTGLTTKLSDNVAFQFGVMVRFDNQPVEGREKVDTGTQAGLVVNFL